MLGKNLKNLKITFIFSICTIFIFTLNVFQVVYADEESKVMLCGTPFGIKLFTDGVMLVETGDIVTTKGIVNPAVEANLQIGDNIKQVNGISIKSNEQLCKIISENGANSLDLVVERDNNIFATKLTPVQSLDDGVYRAGMWIRDSCAGIGTLTFYNPQTHAFAGLGHGICDVDTGKIMPLQDGEIVPACIGSVVKGEIGVPGELKGYFTQNNAFGQIKINNEKGVYGLVSDTDCNISTGQTIETASREEINQGAVKILTTIDGQEPKFYDGVIETISNNEENNNKDLTIKITDETLLACTGGIVQGMSGSPIIQDGKLVGAVTHVLVNDPTRGYGIFIENMLDAAG